MWPSSWTCNCLTGSADVTTRMSRLPRFPIFFLAAVHLLLFSICPAVSSRIYETNDAVVIEVDVVVEPSTRSARNVNYRRNPAAAISMPYPVNPYYSGLYQQGQPNFLSWFYPLRKNQASVSSSSVSDVIATRTPESKQQQTITYCGDGPASPPMRSITPGNPPVVSIVGGTEAIPNSWPFIVGLRKGGNNVFCGGSLISPTRILTAAHCVNKYSVSEIASMTVSLGMHTQGHLPNTVNDAQQTRRVTRAVYHKDYSDLHFPNDVAILTIDPPVIYSKDISPVCLPPANQDADQFAEKNAAIIGWGSLFTHQGQQPNALQQTTIQVISQATCNQFWIQSSSPVSNQHVCSAAAGRDICQGDSGGPMIAQLKEGSTTWIQIGITSFGNRCPADKNRPSVYANVAYFRDWIDRYTIYE